MKVSIQNKDPLPKALHWPPETGQRVTVHGPVDTEDTIWVDEMDDYDGQTGEVVKIQTEYISDPAEPEYRVRFDDGNTWYFILEWLRPIDERPAPPAKPRWTPAAGQAVRVTSLVPRNTDPTGLQWRFSNNHLLGRKGTITRVRGTGSLEIDIDGGIYVLRRQWLEPL